MIFLSLAFRGCKKLCSSGEIILLLPYLFVIFSSDGHDNSIYSYIKYILKRAAY